MLLWEQVKWTWIGWNGRGYEFNVVAKSVKLGVITSLNYI